VPGTPLGTDSLGNCDPGVADDGGEEEGAVGP
jgi:hypothetical protein